MLISHNSFKSFIAILTIGILAVVETSCRSQSQSNINTAKTETKEGTTAQTKSLNDEDPKNESFLYVIVRAKVQQQYLDNGAFQKLVRTVAVPTRKESGNVYYEPFLVGIGPEVLFYEAWKNRSAAIEHGDLPHTKKFLEGLKSMLASVPSNEFFTVIGRVDGNRAGTYCQGSVLRTLTSTILESRPLEVTLAKLKKSVFRMRQEQGNLSFELLQNIKDKSQFMSFSADSESTDSTNETIASKFIKNFPGSKSNDSETLFPIDCE